MKNYLCLAFIYFISLIVSAQETDKTELQKMLDRIEGLEYELIDTNSLEFEETYQIFLEQPIDHTIPESGKFKQRIFLSHRDFDRPTLIETEGYAAFNHTKELSSLLTSNQIIVEHRYFGESKPDSIVWKYLNIKQVADDHHRIIELFKKIYTGKWISSGISKGGQTAIYHRYFYPKDVDVTVPYVAPLNLAKEDARINKFINNVGDEDSRRRITSFQRAVLQKRDSILVLLKNHVEKKKYNFSMSLDLVLEYNVLEYSFSFWQWGKYSSEKIPNPNASAKELFDHLVAASPFSYLGNKSKKYLAPFFFQAYTQLGYYGYDITQFNDLLVELKGDYVSSIFMVPDVELEFDKSVMEGVNDWVINNGNNMLYIYGEYDPWSATSVTIGKNTNAVKMVKKEGCHKTRIRSFQGEEKEKIYSTLEDWLEIKIKRDK